MIYLKHAPDSSQFRLNRLNDCQKAILRLAIQPYCSDRPVKSLEDHHGNLIVIWNDYQSFALLASSVNEIWSQQFGEPIVEHKVANKPGLAIFTDSCEPDKLFNNMEMRASW